MHSRDQVIEVSNNGDGNRQTDHASDAGSVLIGVLLVLGAGLVSAQQHRDGSAEEVEIFQIEHADLFLI